MLPKSKKYGGGPLIGPPALRSPGRPPVSRLSPGPPVVPKSPGPPVPPGSTGPVWSGCDTLEICTSGLAKLNHFFPLKSQTEEFAANWYFLMGGPLPSCTRYLASCLLLIYRKCHRICVSLKKKRSKSRSKIIFGTNISVKETRLFQFSLQI